MVAPVAFVGLLCFCWFVMEHSFDAAPEASINPWELIVKPTSGSKVEHHISMALTIPNVQQLRPSFSTRFPRGIRPCPAFAEKERTRNGKHHLNTPFHHFEDVTTGNGVFK